MIKKLFVIGCGTGSEEMLTTEAKNINCEKYFAFDRLAQQLENVYNNIEKCTYKELMLKIKQCDATKIGVLLSGDVGFYSMAHTLKLALEDEFLVEYICGISSMQYFCAQLKLNYQEIKTVSMHGRKGSLLGSIAYNKYTFVLTGGENKADVLLKELVQNGLSHIEVSVGENLGAANMRIIKGSVEELAHETFEDLTVLLFENGKYIELKPLFDSDFVRNKTPMTKQEVRWVSVNALCIKPDDIVFDIGAGSGSVAIEMARKAYDGIVYAIEKQQEAYELIKTNKERLGAYNLIAIKGDGREEISKLPMPKCAFIGGSGGELKDILENLYGRNPKLKVVINAITLETLNLSLEILKNLNITADVCCINSARNKKVGEYNLMCANNPVYIISGANNNE